MISPSDIKSLLAAIAVTIGIGAVSAWLVGRIREWSLAKNVIDVPNERSSHSIPTPRAGGLAIASLTWLTVALSVATGLVPRAMIAWLVGAAGVAVISWLDDLRGVSNAIRFLVHTLAAILAVSAFGGWQAVAVGSLATVDLGLIGTIATVIWIVGLTNAWNFMDGIDGIAGLSAIVAAASLLALSRPSVAAAALALPLAASTAGFLLSNWPPAKIFMGDVGSAFLGYSLAVMPLLENPSATVQPWLALLPVWPFVFDTSFTFLRRASRRENVFAAHRSHLYQRLVIAGWSHRQTTILYALFSLGGGAVAFAIDRGVMVAAGVTFMLIAALLLWRVTVTVERRHSDSTGRTTQPA